MSIKKVILKYSGEDVTLNLALKTFRDKMNEMIDNIPWLTSSSEYIRLEDTNDTHYLQVFWGEDETVDNRTLEIDVNAANRVINLAGNLSITGNLTTTAANKVTLWTVNTLALATGSITDSGGAIDFGDENLSTDGYIKIGAQNELRFYDNGNYVGFEAPALGADQIWVLPTADGAVGEHMVSDGAGTLSWTTGAGTGDVSAAANFATDNVIITSDGVAKGVQHTGSIIDASGNWGVGHTDVEAWHATYGAVEFFNSAFMYHKSDSSLYMLSNIYYDGAWKYKANNPACIYTHTDTVVSWRFAATGVADNAATATQNFRITSGIVFVGDDTTNAKMTQGLTINQAGNDDEILALKSSDTGHGVTDRAETDTYCSFGKESAANAGLRQWLFSELNVCYKGIAVATTDNTTKGAAGTAPYMIQVYKKSGTTTGAVGANANLVAIGKGSSAVWILDEDGDIWQNGNITMANATSTITGGTALALESSSNVRSIVTRDNTTASAATMWISSVDGHFKRSTSGAKYKDNIAKLELDSTGIYNLRPVSFDSKCKGEVGKRFHGLIADDVGQIYPEIVNYNKNNEAENYDNQMLITLILAEVQQLRQELDKLKSQKPTEDNDE